MERSGVWPQLLLSLLLCIVATNAVSIQDQRKAPCTTDACCREQYRLGVGDMSWCIVDVVVDTQGHGCRILPRCGAGQRCIPETHECAPKSSSSSSSLHGSSIGVSNASCDALVCNLCAGQKCNSTTDLCEQVGEPIVCGEGSICSPLQSKCVPKPCAQDSDCIADTVFCNGAPKCDFSNSTCVIIPACPLPGFPLCSEDREKCNSVCVGDSDCMLPGQTFCDNVRACDVENDWCLQSVPRCDSATESCDALNKVCVPLPPATPTPVVSIVEGNVLIKWVAIIWLFTFIGVILCCIIVWLARKPPRDYTEPIDDATRDAPKKTRKR